MKFKSTATDPGWKNWEVKEGVLCLNHIDFERLPEISKMKSLRVSTEELKSKEVLDDEERTLLERLERDLDAEYHR